MSNNPFEAQYWEDEQDELYDVMLPFFLLALWGGIDGGTDILPDNLQPLVNLDNLNQAALEYVKDYRFTYIRDITDTTRKQTQKAISDWILSGDPLPVLEKTLSTIYGEARAARIAATETTRAFAQGNMAAWESTGFIRSAVWMTSQDERVCVICAEHEGEHVGIGDIDAAPPNSSHVGCRCWLQPEVDEKLVDEIVKGILNQ
jgi:SPP1 gp7 family putative phage head morphogenesis protein